jgi:hypothetical protein
MTLNHEADIDEDGMLGKLLQRNIYNRADNVISLNLTICPYNESLKKVVKYQIWTWATS